MSTKRPRHKHVRPERPCFQASCQSYTLVLVKVGTKPTKPRGNLAQDLHHRATEYLLRAPQKGLVLAIAIQDSKLHHRWNKWAKMSPHRSAKLKDTPPAFVCTASQPSHVSQWEHPHTSLLHVLVALPSSSGLQTELLQSSIRKMQN